MRIRRSDERGHFENDWLNSYYTFSFAEYFDQKHMHFHDLRVINEDVIQPSGGFATHGHRNMEIITYVVEGTVAHTDSMGNSERIKAGEVQVMSAGTGVRHSEFNPDDQSPLKLFQIWVIPNQEGLTPSYQQGEFPTENKLNRLGLIASMDGAENSLKIHQDVRLYASILEPGQSLDWKVADQRAQWLQIIRGQLEVNGTSLNEGDALAVERAGEIQALARQESEFLLFDLAKR